MRNSYYDTVPVKYYMVSRYNETETGKRAYSAFPIENLEAWMLQNRANYIDECEGSLLDNYVLSCKRGTAFIFERYLNSNSSGYECYFIPEHANNKILNYFWDEFEQLRKQIEQEEA